MWLALADEQVRQFLLPGIAAVVVAILAWLGDRRQMRRSDPDAVALINWRELSFWASLAALVLLGLAAHSWIFPA